MTPITCYKKAHKNSSGNCLCIFSPMWLNHLQHLNWYSVKNVEGFELCVPHSLCCSACALKGENASGARRVHRFWVACLPCWDVALQIHKRCFAMCDFYVSLKTLGRAQLSEELPLKLLVVLVEMLLWKLCLNWRLGNGWVSLVASLVFWLYPHVFQRGFISAVSNVEYQEQKMKRV